VDAATAQAWGLVNRVTEPAELRAAVQKLAESILGVSPVAVARCLESVSVGEGMSIERALELEATLFGMCFAAEDAREGVAAFLEKRPASFPGR